MVALGVGRLMQTAFIVEDIRAAMEQATTSLGAGPWFLRERGQFANQTYRGEPAQTELSIAMAYSGDMLIELIEQHDDGPSVYRDVVTSRSFGLHHFGISTDAFDELCKQYENAGMVRVYSAEVAHGARVAYFKRSDLPYMIEAIELLPMSAEMFAQIRQAHSDWTGDFEIRPLAPLRK
jgi:Glyoxalase/Bleomycin resistance protein/Dioxygenase superfamily